MTNNLRECMKDLLLLSKYKKPRRDVVLEHLANKECIWNAIREIAHNVIRKNIKLKRKQKKRLNKYSKVIKGIANGTNNKGRRKRLLQQTGGFIQWLIPVIATLLPNVIDALR